MSTEAVIWARRAQWLVVLTLAYNLAEAALALGLGWVVGSVLLVGFGLDSLIEAVAAVAVLPRLRAVFDGRDEVAVQALEKRVHRVVGGTFLALAIYIAAQSLYMLITRDAPAESWLGILLALFSLVVMPIVAYAKLVCARHLGSRALEAEAKETLACSYLSFTLFLGLAANAAFAWWWMDPIAALAMVPWLIWEGLEGIRGECCCD